MDSGSPISAAILRDRRDSAWQMGQQSCGTTPTCQRFARSTITGARQHKHRLEAVRQCVIRVRAKLTLIGEQISVTHERTSRDSEESCASATNPTDWEINFTPAPGVCAFTGVPVAAREPLSRGAREGSKSDRPPAKTVSFQWSPREKRGTCRWEQQLQASSSSRALSSLRREPKAPMALDLEGSLDG